MFLSTCCTFVFLRTEVIISTHKNFLTNSFFCSTKKNFKYVRAFFMQSCKIIIPQSLYKIRQKFFCTLSPPKNYFGLLRLCTHIQTVTNLARIWSQSVSVIQSSFRILTLIDKDHIHFH